jgi:S-adenosylmethionine:tRNA ribosyltransferase-isomerase
LCPSRNPETLPTSAFDYALPPHLIASHPVPRRDESRLLVVHRTRNQLEHRTFREIGALIPPGDVVVLNETRVIPARLLGRKTTGARAEVLLLHPVGEGQDADGGIWEALVRPGAKLRPGHIVEIGDDLRVEILESTPEGNRIVRLVTPLTVHAAIEKHGVVPLPPYLEREAEPADVERYQTVYARAAGSVAAPTAGLHFTPGLLAEMEASGVLLTRIVLHVGPGTFRPVEVADPQEHRLHEEWYDVPAVAARAITEARAAGGRVWAVGTTVARTLETAVDAGGAVHAGSGRTSLFIRPGHRFRAVDRLLTNFHLPRSTLLMLACAFGGYERIMQAYREAMAREYRFYSYGDAMLVI